MVKSSMNVISASHMSTKNNKLVPVIETEHTLQKSSEVKLVWFPQTEFTGKHLMPYLSSVHYHLTKTTQNIQLKLQI